MSSKTPLLAGAQRRVKILVLHQHYWPETAATAQILSDLCEDLVRGGFDVTVVCGQPSYRTEAGSRSRRADETRNGVRIRRVRSFIPRQRGVPQRLLHYGSYFSTSLSAALAEARPDLCFVMSTPPLLLGISGVLLRALRGVPFVYSVQDLYPDIAIHLGVLRETGVVTAAVNLVAERCYAAAHAVVTLSPGMAARLIAKGVTSQRVHVIPNWADTDMVSPQPRDNGLARELGLHDGFVVQYSGNVGLSQDLDTLVTAAAMLRDLPVRFAIVGDGNARDSLRTRVSSEGLHNVSFHPPQPRERLSELLGACDVGLVTMKPGVANDLVPSKLYGIMAAARPVLASVDGSSEVAMVVQANDCGWATEPESAHALAASIRKAFCTSEARRTELGTNGRNACVANYSRSSCTAKYVDLIRRTVESFA